MGLFESFLRFIRTVLGLAQGSTERATDNLLTSSPDAIRSQFRKTREDMVHDYNAMTESIADLMTIKNQRTSQLSVMHKQVDELAAKMTGAINLYKQNKDESMRVKYAQLSEQKTALESNMDALDTQIKQQESLISQYRGKVVDLEASINNLKNEEAETVADIVSTRRITEINQRLQGLAIDTQSKNLEAIRDARQKMKSIADLSADLSGKKMIDLDKQLLSEGQSTKNMLEFDQLVGLEKLVTVEPVTINRDGSIEVENLFKEKV